MDHAATIDVCITRLREIRDDLNRDSVSTLCEIAQEITTVAEDISDDE